MAELPQGDAAGGPVFIALGSNLAFEGRRGPALLALALDRIAAAGARIVARSSYYESPFWPPRADQPAVVNAVAEIDAGDWTPEALYAVLAETERVFGRDRSARSPSRTLDLDIVDFAGRVQGGQGLILPHPRAHERAFVLAPLAEIAPAWRHPILGQTAAELLALLEETGAGGVRALSRLPRVIGPH